MSGTRRFSVGRIIGVGSLALAGGILATSRHSEATTYIVAPPPPSVPGATAPIEAAGATDAVVNARFRLVHFHMRPGVALDLGELTGRNDAD